MNKQIVPFAGYPIFLLENGFHLNEEELNFLRNLEYQNHSTLGNLKLSVDTDILQLDKLKRLKEFVKKCLDDYVSNVLEINNSFSFCQSWSTIQHKQGQHQIHAHANHIISSVYYAKTKGTDLRFVVNKSIIQDGYFLEYDIKNYNIYNSTTYSVPLKQGDIIFFPGQIHHGSSINNDDERIIVGSSFFIDGKIGSKHLTSNIDINNNKDTMYK